MSPRFNDAQERKDKILGIVVERYIETIIPVSSSWIVQEHNLDLSSATIRNVLAELEESGYLTHPHTSAGRIPTSSGYRYYVDHLMDEIQLLEEEKYRIQTEYKQGIIELESLFEKTSQVMADLTHCTSIISLDGPEHKVFCRGTSFIVGYPEYQDFNKIRHLLEVLEEKERILEIINRHLEKRIEIFIGREIECVQVEGCSLAISTFKKENGPSGRIAVLGPTSMHYERVISALEYISELVSQRLSR